MVRGLVGVGLGLLVAGLALAAPAGAMQTTPSTAEPDDRAPPSIAPAKPDRAQKPKIGRTQMICHVEADGALTGCSVVFECPKELGFGEAALDAARTRKIKMQPMTIDGKPVGGGTILIPMVWKLQPPRNGRFVPTPVGAVVANFDRAEGGECAASAATRQPDNTASPAPPTPPTTSRP